MNASRKPGEWQTYDVVWTAPTFNADGSVKTPAYVTVFFNGVLVQNHFELKGETLYIGKPFYKKYDTRADQAAGARRPERADQLPEHLGQKPRLTVVDRQLGPRYTVVFLEHWPPAVLGTCSVTALNIRVARDPGTI